MITPPVLLAAAVGVILGALVGLAVSRSRERARRVLEKQGAQGEASRILERARDEADNIRKAGELAGREEGFRLREAWEKDESRRREDVERAERRAEERRQQTQNKNLERLLLGFLFDLIKMGNGKSGSHSKPLHASNYDFNDELLVIGSSYWAELAEQQLK